jgi:hypothetical protein
VIQRQDCRVVTLSPPFAEPWEKTNGIWMLKGIFKPIILEEIVRDRRLFAQYEKLV